MTSSASALNSLPGYRRRFRITPAPGRVVTELEDDYHCMKVTLDHDGERVAAIAGEMIRAPWTTCPGAPAQLKAFFTGLGFSDFATLGEKTSHCTHLYDLALLGGAHAHDTHATLYDVRVSDPVDGTRHLELHRDGRVLMQWTETNGVFTEPAEVRGLTLYKLRSFIDAQTAARQEAARILRWGAIVALGRTMPMDQQSDASVMPPSCYTFQPMRKDHAVRVGEIRDFSHGALPLS